MAKILITGGTGLVGTKLISLLEKKGNRVRVLTRSPKKNNEFKWDLSSNYIAEEALRNIDYIIHLAGAGIAEKRWSKDRKKVIIDSRVNSANLLFTKIKELDISLKGFISASGTGYYGAKTSEDIFIESDLVGSDFLGEVCNKWESAAMQFKDLKTPVSLIRTGIVLSEKGGALEKMRTPIIAGLGSGNQYLPWIHIEDLCNLYIKAIEDKLEGAFNAVAPEFHTSISFSKILAMSTSKPFTKICVPGLLLKIVFGEMATILLEGSRVSSKKIEQLGFKFKYPELSGALKELF
ncbi:TIGR01777 family oxidoreductase [Polaribacter sp.]|uniref:TIGR01777 family oxidoreductase n=1 Tax=Polaribacter sp. TaxID=1920175 RepID=UPI0025EB7A1C|nr:TIGR01777 family oxidoreductase [Polaribacter sp.]